MHPSIQTRIQGRLAVTHAPRPFTGPDLCRLEAHEVVSLLKRRDVSPKDLLDAAYARTEQVEPAINATPTLCPDRAYAHAKALDDRHSDHPGWLAGLPIGIKDLDRVKGVRCTYGTLGLADFIPEVSEHFVDRLEDRGGIVVGKTNTPEMGAGGNTFNEVFGRTRNPHDTSLNAAGSSGGAAAALAAGEHWLSQGSDHGGSLRTPAAYCGVVGMRTSPGRVATTLNKGAANGWGAEGVMGSMARSVRDAALFLDAMSSFEPLAPLSFPPPDVPFQQTVLQADGNVRIAYSADLDGLSPVEPVIADAISAALAQVEKSGGTVDAACPDLSGLERTYRVLRGFGQATGYARMPDRITRHFKQTIQENWAYGRSVTAEDVSNAQIDRTTIFLNVMDLLGRFDVLAFPTVGNMPRKAEVEWVDEVNGVKLDDYMSWLRFAFLATTTGLPAISVPIGFSPAGLPIGLQLLGPHRGEAKLLAAARAVEMAVGGPFGPIDPNVTHH
jgi:amidase